MAPMAALTGRPAPRKMTRMGLALIALASLLILTLAIVTILCGPALISILFFAIALILFLTVLVAAGIAKDRLMGEDWRRVCEMWRRTWPSTRRNR